MTNNINNKNSSNNNNHNNNNNKCIHLLQSSKTSAKDNDRYCVNEDYLFTGVFFLLLNRQDN